MHRERLLEAMAASIDEKGYAATTIADVVARARVSKRTFYEHFADKEAAFLATYAAVSDQMLAVFAEVPSQDRIEARLHAYLTELAAHPTLTRTFLLEIQAAGPRALALRREVVERFAARLVAVAPGLDPRLAVAAVGGINELLLRAIEQGEAEDLPALSGVAAELIRRVVAA